MINLKNQTIELHGRGYPIEKYQVWWAVEGYGLFDSLEQALSFGQPVQSIPVAVASSGMYEVLPPELHNDSESRSIGKVP